MQSNKPRMERSGWTAQRPKGLPRLESIVDSVWGELRQYPDRDSIKRQVAERVALYSASGLPDDHRIIMAVLNSFGRAA
jgi:elongation factor P hydroxylase